MAVEVFANDAAATVTAGPSGSTAPSAGTVETWTFSVSTFAAISSSASPATHSFAADTTASAETEKVDITNVTGSGPYTATVTRGADGTAPVTHAVPFTLQQVIAAGSCAAFQTPVPAQIAQRTFAV